MTLERETAGWWPQAPPARRALVDRLAAELLAERERWPLWLPVAFAAGIGLYFALPAEPPPWLGPVGLGFAFALALLGRGRAGTLLPALAAGMVAGGFAAAQARTAMVAAPMLTDEHGPADVVGTVIETEPRGSGRSRLLLRHADVEGLAPAATPVRLRVTVAGGAPGIEPGDRVRLLAVLRPPPAPSAPGAFDFARRAYFERLGAVGYALGHVEEVAGAPGGASGWSVWWSGLRHDISRRVMAAVPGEGGAVAAALMTGERGAIPERVLVAMRESGLAHLLAISGLHVGLVAGLVFFAVRAGLASVPAVALRYPIKKWAAAAAAVGAFAYLFLAGATIPTQRAFLMLGLVLLGVGLDRSAVSMRLVAWAAFAILLLHPESLLSASFQMSFAAVTALVAAYEALRAKGLTRPGEAGLPSRAGLYLAGVALSSVVAILATAPFAVHHFNRLALFGLAANLAAVPLTAFWIMPWALLAFLLMPLGWEVLALTPMGWGTQALIAVAETVAGWPGSATIVPVLPLWGLVLVALGGLWLCLWQRRWRLVGLAPVAAGLLTIALYRPPDVLVTGDGRLMAVRGPQGELSLSSDRVARFSAGIWLRRAGQAEARVWPATGAAAGGWLTCDPLGCIYRARGQVVALVRDGRALAEDCRVATIMVSLEPVPRRRCPGPEVLIDRFDLWRNGAHALRLGPGAVDVKSVRDHRGARPWVVNR